MYLRGGESVLEAGLSDEHSLYEQEKVPEGVPEFTM